MLYNRYTDITIERMSPTFDYYANVAPTVSEKAPTYTNGKTWKNVLTGTVYVLRNETLGTWVTLATLPSNFPKAWTVVGSVRGFIQEVSSESVMTAGKNGQKVRATLYTDLLGLFQYGDRLAGKWEVLTDGQADGVSSTGHHREIKLGEFS